MKTKFVVATLAGLSLACPILAQVRSPVIVTGAPAATWPQMYTTPDGDLIIVYQNGSSLKIPGAPPQSISTNAGELNIVWSNAVPNVGVVPVPGANPNPQLFTNAQGQIYAFDKLAVPAANVATNLLQIPGANPHPQLFTNALGQVYAFDKLVPPVANVATNPPPVAGANPRPQLFTNAQGQIFAFDGLNAAPVGNVLTNPLPVPGANPRPQLFTNAQGQVFGFDRVSPPRP